jgi:LSD1 subclass zinc finger protein
VTCPSCYGPLKQVDGTSLYRCADCDIEYDEDELEEQ